MDDSLKEESILRATHAYSNRKDRLPDVDVKLGRLL